MRGEPLFLLTAGAGAFTALPGHTLTCTHTTNHTLEPRATPASAPCVDRTHGSVSQRLRPNNLPHSTSKPARDSPGTRVTRDPRPHLASVRTRCRREPVALVTRFSWEHWRPDSWTPASQGLVSPPHSTAGRPRGHRHTGPQQVRTPRRGREASLLSADALTFVGRVLGLLPTTDQCQVVAAE